jgi:DNA-binding beta-propeller fold protein YncE
MAIRLIKKFTVFLKKLFSIFLIFNLTCVSTAQAAGVFVDSFTLTYTSVDLPEGIAFNSDGTKMFVTDQGADIVAEYTLTTGFDVSTASFVDSLNISGEEGAASGLAFNNDGTKMFVLGRSGRDVTEYTLTTGFDVSSASVVDSFSVLSEESDPAGLAFNNDGTKMFVAGINEDKVHEYILTTGFDVSTASFVVSLDISSQEDQSADLAFNTDGTKMFLVGRAEDVVNEYTLTAGFNISTASFVGSFDVSGEEGGPAGLAFNDDGTKMFITGWDGEDVNEYTLSCAFKVTSSSACDDPTTIKNIVGSIEAQTEAAKRFAKKSSGSVLKRLDFLRSHQKDLGYFLLKDGSLRGFIGDSQDIDVNFSNKTLDQLTDLAPKFSVRKKKKILPRLTLPSLHNAQSSGRIF